MEQDLFPQEIKNNLQSSTIEKMIVMLKWGTAPFRDGWGGSGGTRKEAGLPVCRRGVQVNRAKCWKGSLQGRDLGVWCRDECKVWNHWGKEQVMPPFE